MDSSSESEGCLGLRAFLICIGHWVGIPYGYLPTSYMFLEGPVMGAKSVCPNLDIQAKSPKRSRRNGKPTMERSPNRLSPETREKDDDRKHRHRLHDPLPLDKPHASDSKHNDRNNAGQDGTSTGRGGKSVRVSWRNHDDDRRGKRHASSDAPEKDEKPIARKDDSRFQSRDEPSKTNADHPHPARKKFREEKLPTSESQPSEKAAAAVKIDERGTHRYQDRSERDRGYVGGRSLPYRARAGVPYRDRYQDGISGNRFGGREGYVERQGYGAASGGGGRVDKWKHDLFDEVNKSPTSKNEEDPVAKAEALLAL